MPTIQLRTRIDRDLVNKSEALLKRLGLDAGTFFALSLTQLVNRRGLPFAVTEADADYFKNEYDLSEKEAAAAGRRMKSEASRARRAGKLREIKTLSDLNP